MLNEAKKKNHTPPTKIEFTTDPRKPGVKKELNLHNQHTFYRSYLESDQYLPPESIVFIQFLDKDKNQEKYKDGYIPAKVDWCFKKEDCYETAIMFIDNICDQCNKQLTMEETYRTENHNTLCRNCYYKILGLKNSRLKKSIEKQLLGNVL